MTQDLRKHWKKTFSLININGDRIGRNHLSKKLKVNRLSGAEPEQFELFCNYVEFQNLTTKNSFDI